MEQTGDQPGADNRAEPADADADAEQPVGELVVLRHGATQWSSAGKHTGRTDVPLSLDGERQAERVGALIADRTFALVLASPLRRAQLTAELAGLPRFETDADLVEWDYGGYEGMTTAGDPADHPGVVVVARRRDQSRRR